MTSSPTVLNSDIFSFFILVFTLLAAGIVFIYRSRKSLRDFNKKFYEENFLLKSLVDCSSEGILVVDFEGKVLLTNSVLFKLLDIKKDDLHSDVSKLSLNCINPETKQFLNPDVLPLAKVLKGAEEYAMNVLIQNVHLAKDIYLNIHARPIFDSNKSKKAVLVQFSDVTLQKLSEKGLKARHESTIESSQMKTEFFSQVSEELSSSLSRIVDGANSLLKDSISPEQKEYAKNISLAAHYSLNKVQVILDQTIFEKGELRIVSRAFNLNEILLHIIDILGPLAQEKKTQILLDSEVESDLEVVSDPIRLKEILIAALEEALLQAEKGFVSFKVRVLEVFDGKARFYFEIKNSSAKPLVDLRSSKRLKIRLKKEIIRLLEGEAAIDYKEGRGTRLSLTFDLKLKRRNEKNIIKRYTQISSDKPILVAEDQFINQMLIRKYLERFGLPCHIVTDGRAAFLEATTGQYALVLMDCKMRPIDGYEATQLIRTHEKRLGTRIPIIALTADGTVEDREYCEQVGMDDYITKPIDLMKLEILMQKWLRPVLKEEYIKKLDGYEMEGKPLFQVLAEDYFTSTPVLISKLEKAIEDQDLKQIQYFSHALKSASISLGLVELSSYCEKLEYASEVQPSTGQILNLIKESYKKCEPILRNRMYSPA